MGLENGTNFPAMAASTRAAQIAEARVVVAELRADVDRLIGQAGHEEDVVDQAGVLRMPNPGEPAWLGHACQRGAVPSVAKSRGTGARSL